MWGVVGGGAHGRRRCARTAAVLAAALGLAACADEDPRPSLLLVTVDSLRADRLHCYGGPEHLGRAICELAEPGALYLWAFASAPSGGPAAASILTSRWASHHGLGDSPAAFLPSGTPTLARLLGRAGYATAAVVRSPEIGRSRNLHQGFQHFAERADGEPGAAEATDAALRWVAALEAPWLLWVHYGDLHGPFPAPPIRNYEEYEARYRERLVALDAEIGRLVAAARADGVVLAGTHGEAAGERGAWFEHGHSLGLEQLRVPLLWRAPGASSAERIATPVTALDVTPTLLAAAGVSVPEGFEGVALPRSGDPPAAPGPRPVFAERPGQIAVVEGRDYYARGRRPRIGARYARLPEDGRLPETVPARRGALRARIEQLEAHLGEFERRAEEPSADDPYSVEPPETGPTSPPIPDPLEPAEGTTLPKEWNSGSAAAAPPLRSFAGRLASR